MPGNRVQLLALADREYRQLAGKPSSRPAPRRLKPIRLNLAKFDGAWDRKRGAAVRLMGVLLCEDDETLKRRVCASDHSARTYAEAATWLQRESAYLRKVARLLETGSHGPALTLLNIFDRFNLIRRSGGLGVFQSAMG